MESGCSRLTLSLEHHIEFVSQGPNMKIRFLLSQILSALFGSRHDLLSEPPLTQEEQKEDRALRLKQLQQVTAGHGNESSHKLERLQTLLDDSGCDANEARAKLVEPGSQVPMS